MERSCHDLWGLLVVPDGSITQARTLRNLSERLRFGGKIITWQDVTEKNLYVRTKRFGNPEIRPFGSLPEERLAEVDWLPERAHVPADCPPRTRSAT